MSNKKWTVDVTMTQSYITSIEVEAATEKLAIEKAIELARDIECGSFDYIGCDYHHVGVG